MNKILRSIRDVTDYVFYAVYCGCLRMTEIAKRGEGMEEAIEWAIVFMLFPVIIIYITFF